MPKLMKSNTQNKAIFALGAKWKMHHEDLRDLAFDVTQGRTDKISELTFDEANGMISRLGGTPFHSKSKRTVQHYRQQAGIKQIATEKHLKLMRDLAERRGMSAEGLGDISAGVNKGNRTPHTTKEVNNVIEALKAMNKRDRIFGAFKQETAA